MANKRGGGMQKCRVCGSSMIMDETVIEGGNGTKIKRTFLHCVNGQCGHIQRVAEFTIDAAGQDPIARAR